MSVFTSLSAEELTAFLQHYTIGDLVDFQGISEGIENTNYFVNTDKEKTVLTIFEQFAPEELPYFLSLMDFVATHTGFSARPYPDADGNLFRIVKNKPAAFVKRMSGKSTNNPDAKQCFAVGVALAKLHLATTKFSGFRANDRSVDWWKTTAKKCLPVLDTAQANLLSSEMAAQIALRELAPSLPTAVIHADLFRDNVLFDGQEISGIIDFYYACNDWMLYDIAVTLNDWCSFEDGSLDMEKTQAILRAYQRVRPIKQDEMRYLPMLLRAGALRFWMSRLKDHHFPREGEMTHTKDPDVFLRILTQRIAQQSFLTEQFLGML